MCANFPSNKTEIISFVKLRLLSLGSFLFLFSYINKYEEYFSVLHNRSNGLMKSDQYIHTNLTKKKDILWHMAVKDSNPLHDSNNKTMIIEKSSCNQL